MVKPLTTGRISTPSEPPNAARVLVDRLWPRGVSKLSAPWDLWAQGMAPSTTLRQWYGHDSARYEEFRERYVAELTASLPNSDVENVLALWREKPVMLLTASRQLDPSHVSVLQEFLLNVAAQEGALGV